jgi:hypothetical protein
MPILGVCTYIVVFNLDNIAALFGRTRAPAPTRRLLSQQITGTRDFSTGTWENHGFRFGNYGAPQGRPSSFWHILLFYMRQLLLKGWITALQVRRLMPHGLTKDDASIKGSSPVSHGDLRDIRVQVQVDVESRSAGTVESD